MFKNKTNLHKNTKILKEFTFFRKFKIVLIQNENLIF